MQTLLLALLLLFTELWPSSAWTTPPTYSYHPASSQTQHSYHSYHLQPDASYQHPYAFDFSHLFTEQATAAAKASAYATNAAQFAQQFTHQLASAPPVNAQVDQQNIEKYSQYLDILQNAYGIQLPGELGHHEGPQQYQLSAYPTATATSYQAGASPYVTTSQPAQTAAIAEPSVSAPAYPTVATSQPQPQYQVYQPQQSIYGSQQQLTYQTAAQPSQPTSSIYPVVYPDSQGYSQMQQQTQQSHTTPQVSPQSVPSVPFSQHQAVQQPSKSSQALSSLHTSPTAHPAPGAYSYGPTPTQTTYTFPQSEPQYPQQKLQYPPNPSPYAQQQSSAAIPQQQYASLSPPQIQQPQQPQQLHPQYPAYPQQEVHLQPAPPQLQTQHPAYPQQPVQPQPAQPQTQVHQQSHIHGGDMHSLQAERPTPAYQTAAFSTYNGQPPPPKPQVYIYPGPGQILKPSYSTNVAANSAISAEQRVEENSVEEPETVGSVYGAPNPSEPAAYIPHNQPQPTHPPTLPPTLLPPTRPTTQRPTTTRPRITAPPTPPPTRPSSTTKNPEVAVSVQALTKQIRRLPAVLYLDSRMEGSAELETLLRETYGLPLVAFYVDKVGRPQLAQKNLYQLTAHKGLPYLFICGTFIGSKQHIQNYHKNGQIPQLVEYVCGDEKKKNRTNKVKKTTS